MTRLPFRVYFHHFGFRAYRHDIANGAGDAYMERWILETPLGTLRLHHILRSDDDRALHDHPWSFVSVLLWGSYLETRFLWPDQPRICARRGLASVRRVRWWNTCRAEAAHRLELDRGPVWTLVATTRKTRSWGFWLPGGWVPWRDYEREIGVLDLHGPAR